MSLTKEQAVELLTNLVGFCKEVGYFPNSCSCCDGTWLSPWGGYGSEESLSDVYFDWDKRVVTATIHDDKIKVEVPL